MSDPIKNAIAVLRDLNAKPYYRLQAADALDGLATASGDGREGLRESVARIIDPPAWSGREKRTDLWRRTHTLKLADRILALPGMGGDIAAVWKQAEDNHRTYSDTGDRESDIRFLTLGLTGEAGEVANFVKKRWRDGEGHDEAIRLEIADVCAYAFMLASTMGMAPADLIGTIAHKQQVFIDKMRALRALAASSGGKQ